MKTALVLRRICIIVLLAAGLAHPCLALENRTVRIDVTLPDEVMLGLTYSTLFKLTNLNYSRNYDSRVNVTVYYNLTRQGVVVYENNFTKLVNSFSTSSNGYLFFNELGAFTLCASSPLADDVCKEVVVIDPMEVGCFVSVNLSLPKSVFSNNEQVEITNTISMSPQDDYPFILEYWVEDLFGSVVKKRLNTSNDNGKVFTPKIEEKVGAFVVRNSLTYVGCNNTNQNVESSFLFVVKNQDYVEKVLVEKEEANVSRPAGSITSFYTRTKNFNSSINIYANVKTLNGGYVFLTGNGFDQMLKLESSGKSQKLSFNVPARKGGNTFYLELYEEGKAVDKLSLVFSLKEAEKKAARNVTSQTANTSAQPAANSTKRQPAYKAKVEINRSTTNVLDDNLLGIHSSAAENVTGLVVYEVEGSGPGRMLPLLAAIFIGIIALISFFGKNKIVSS